MNSIFADEDDINRTTCTGLTLMHVNILGGKLAWCVPLCNRLIDIFSYRCYTLHDRQLIVLFSDYFPCEILNSIRP
jgi:hypothetical protein